MFEERALSASAAAHDHEDVAPADLERQVLLHDEVAELHRQPDDGDVNVVVPGSEVGHGQIRSVLQRTVMAAQATTIQTMAVTTAEVVASPTAAALRPHCMPRRQPDSAMITP